MIRRILVGRTYMFRGKRALVVERLRGTPGWSPDLVAVMNPDGVVTRHFARHFRDEADPVQVGS